MEARYLDANWGREEQTARLGKSPGKSPGAEFPGLLTALCFLWVGFSVRARAG
jgi:hypothetical protein